MRARRVGLRAAKRDGMRLRTGSSIKTGLGSWAS